MPKIIIQKGHKRPFPWNNFGTGAGGERELAEAVAGPLMSEMLARGWNVSVVPSLFNYSEEADVFISLHADGSSTSTVRGFSIGYHPDLDNAPASKALALRLADHYKTMIKPLRTPPFNYTRNQMYYYAFKRLVNVEAVILLEMGFMSNPQERTFLEGHPNLVASVIATGIAGPRPINNQDEEDEDMPTTRYCCPNPKGEVSHPRIGLLNTFGENDVWVAVNFLKENPPKNAYVNLIIFPNDLKRGEIKIPLETNSNRETGYNIRRKKALIGKDFSLTARSSEPFAMTVVQT